MHLTIKPLSSQSVSSSLCPGITVALVIQTDLTSILQIMMWLSGCGLVFQAEHIDDLTFP